MTLVYPNVTGAMCAKMDRGLSGQDAVNGMLLVFRIIQGGVSRPHWTRVTTKALAQGMGRSVSSWQ